MKRYLSVFEMIARSSIYKVLLAVIGMAVLEAGLFVLTMLNPPAIYFERYIDQSLYSYIFRLAYTVVTIILVLPGMNIGSTQSYSLQRLRIKESRIFWLQFIYNFLAYVVLWGVQLLVIFGSIAVFHRYLPEGAFESNQTYFLAFYRNDFMHSILPLEDTGDWWILGLIGLTSAFAAAEFTKLQRVRKVAFELPVLVVAVWLGFPGGLGYDHAVLWIGISATIAIMCFRWLTQVLNAGGDEA